MEVWVGKVEVRQLPGTDHKVTLSGKGAYTWVTCWASDAANYERKVAEVMRFYGLFVVQADSMMTFAEAENRSFMTDELAEQYEDTKERETHCIFGTLYGYPHDN